MRPPRPRVCALAPRLLVVLSSISIALQVAAQPQVKKLTSTPADGPVPTPVKMADDDFLSGLEQEVLREINLARTNPAQYAAYVDELKPYYKGNSFQPPGYKLALTTREGVTALDEAVRHLRTARPLAPYAPSRGLSLGANLLVREQGPSGQTGHKGADGSFCEQRIGRFGKLSGETGENLSYSAETARQQVINWLIDDGFANRGHRARLLSPAFKVAGVSCGQHAQFGGMCVVTFASGFAEGDGKAGGGLKSF